MNAEALLIDLAMELMETVPVEQVVRVGKGWCYVVEEVLYTSLGKEYPLVGISKDMVGLAQITDGNPTHLIPSEIKLPLMPLFSNLLLLITPA